MQSYAVDVFSDQPVVTKERASDDKHANIESICKLQETKTAAISQGKSTMYMQVFDSHPFSLGIAGDSSSVWKGQLRFLTEMLQYFQQAIPATYCFQVPVRKINCL